MEARRRWRTAFLTLRDEVLTSPPGSTTVILDRLIFSHSQTLIAASTHLPPHEVTCDAMFLMELGLLTLSTSSSVNDEDFDDDIIIHTFTHLSFLIYQFCYHVTFEITSSFWVLLLDFFGRMVEIFLGKSCLNRVSSGNITIIKSTQQCLHTARHVLHGFQRTSLLSEDTQLLGFLLIVVSCSHNVLTSSSSGGNWRCTAESGNTLLGCNSLWEVQTTAFIMIGEVFSRVGTSLPVDEWHSTVKVFRKVMDSLTSRGLLVDGIVMDRFYVSLLQCLHLVLVNAKGSLSNQVAGFIATLRMFFSYGLTSKSPLVSTVAGLSKDLTVTSLTSIPAESNKAPYRPPHLRKKNKNNLLINDMQSMSVSEYESTTFDHMSSDSDLSDGDGSGKDVSNSLGHKARVAAIVCIQDLCCADPKSFTAQWTMLLPSSDVLQRRRYEATLMTCLLFDPYLKVRIASASTLATMLDGPVSVFLQVAEYKESSKCGSFMALSSSLGQILMQVHTGILHLIKHESHTGLMTSLFKILILLLSATPYPRMPAELLPTIILNLRARIEDGFTLRSDQTGLLVVAINCLTAALYTSPPSVKVKDMFMMELSTGFLEDQGTSGVLSTLFHYSRPIMIPTVSIEALQALKAVAHNYPDIVALCWEQVSSVISGFLCLASPEITTKPWNINAGNAVGAHAEKVITYAIRVLDECLRAISGFKGTEDLPDDKLLDSPFTSDNIKIKTISSAPSYGSESSATPTFQHQMCLSGREQWREALEKHIPSTLVHSSAMVRAASITCFAGITSAVFFSLPIEKQDSIITYSINAALGDEVPSVRSAACRSIGVIACFPQVFKSAGILGRFIHAAEFNTRDPLVSVRITASWALANICDSLRHCVNGFTSKGLIDLKDHSQLTSLLIDCSLRLTGDNDKIKANAVRALGNLSRFVQFSSQSSLDDNREEHGTGFEVIKNGGCVTSNSALPPYSGDPQWLDGMVKAFLSCVTTGNVKVRWNVCHALSNLFLNETLKLQVMDWAPSVFSILLLLLRDSSNYKIRIQAAAALAVPPTVLDYGRSFSDVVQGVANILENLSSDQIAAPTSFKYRVSLEQQLTSTMLHVLGLASGTDHQPVQDFLIKKASVLEEWLQVLCTSLTDVTTQLDAEHSTSRNNKKELILKAVQSLVAVYDSRNQHGIARRFDKLGNRML